MNTIKRLKLSAGLSLMMWGLLSVGVAIASATAAPITLSFIGTVTNVGNNLGTTTFSSGQTLSKSYTFNAAVGG